MWNYNEKKSWITKCKMTEILINLKKKKFRKEAVKEKWSAKHKIKVYFLFHFFILIVFMQILHIQFFYQISYFAYFENIYRIFPNISGEFWGGFYKAKVGSSAYIRIYAPQKKITS